MDVDKGKVLLFVNMTMDQDKQEETRTLLSTLNRVLGKYNSPGASQFAVYAQYTNDIQGGEMLLNKDIAQQLIKRGMLSQTLESNNIRFLEKVDVNG